MKAAMKEFEIDPRILAQPVSRRRKWTIGLILLVLIVSNILYFTTALTFAILYFKPNTVTSAAEEIPQKVPVSKSILGRYKTAVVASDNEICSKIGRDILYGKENGNAVEAAIATLFCLGVTDPHASGLGGGHFMTIFNATTKQCYVIDAREVAPSSAKEDMFANESRWNKSKIGWQAVAVPGELHGFWTAYQKFHGKLRWKDLVEPAIKLLEDGVPTSHSLAKALEENENHIMKEQSLKNIFVNPKTGKLFRRGEPIKTRDALKQTLTTLAVVDQSYYRSPVYLFYNDLITNSFVEEFKKNGGLLKAKDFSEYSAILRDKTNGVLLTHLGKEWSVCSPPPPSGAVIVNGILNILDPIQFNTKTSSGVLNFLHRFVEASKLSYADRSQMGDIAFVPDAKKLAEKISTAEWAQKARSKITWSTHPDEYYFENIEAKSKSFSRDYGAAQVVVIDKWGNAVSASSSLNSDFGAFVVSESSGIIWNNQMNSFSTPGRLNYWNYPQSPENYIYPKKRPMSSMSPIVIFNRDILKKELLAMSAAGGPLIMSDVAGAAFRTIWLGENIKQAIDFPRMHNQLQPNYISYESSMPEKYMRELAKKGHQSKPRGWDIDVIGAYRAENGTIFANSDWRKDRENEPAGY